VSLLSVLVISVSYYTFIGMDSGRLLHQWLLPYPSFVHIDKVLVVWLLGLGEFIKARLSNWTPNMMRNNRAYRTFDIGPPFTAQECQEAYILEGHCMFGKGGMDRANKFWRILSALGMFEHNFLNVLLIHLQDNRLTYYWCEVELIILQPVVCNT